VQHESYLGNVIFGHHSVFGLPCPKWRNAHCRKPSSHQFIHKYSYMKKIDIKNNDNIKNVKKKKKKKKKEVPFSFVTLLLVSAMPS
jgi:hypothetical protein